MIRQKNYVQLFRKLFISCSVVYQLSSCTTIKPLPTPHLEYFQSTDSISPVYITTIVPQISKIQKGDILGIIVSSLNKESNDIMNFYNVSSLPVTSFSPGATGGSSGQPIGYPVDSLGNVAIPLIGRQKLEGLTLQQAEEKVRIEVEKTLKDPAVNIRFMNHKFTVLGEVGNVGTFNLLNDQTTIIEAITAAGDLTIFGKRDSIMVIRSANGQREIGRVSLRTRDVFTSPYFYLRHDDIIYVEPTKYKMLPLPPQRQLPNSVFFQRAPFFLSLVTTIITLVVVLSR